MKIIHFILLFTLLGLPSAYGQGNPEQQHTSRFLVQFPVNRSEIDLSFRDNYYAVEELKRFFGTIDFAKVDSISIIGSSSPEGNESDNLALSMRRAEALRNLICTTFQEIPQYKVQLYVKGDTWPEMLKLIRRDDDFPRRGETLVLLETDQAYKARFWLMRFLQYDKSSRYLKTVVFPQLRNAMAVVIHYASEKKFFVYDSRQEYVNNQQFIAPPSDEKPLLDTVKRVTEMDDAIETPTFLIPKALKVRKPLFALKTNLLFDAATLVNAEIEIPLARQWSLAAEFIFPWWLNDDNQYALQMYHANLELKYWFRPRDNQTKGLHPVMTGWHLGVYAGGGLYDFEHQAKGYQGEFFIAAGLSAGYAHSIGKSLRMEYSLGVGYMMTNYRKYEARYSNLDNSWHLYKQETGRFTWIGPTRAKISLVWLLQRNTRKGGLK